MKIIWMAHEIGWLEEIDDPDWLESVMGDVRRVASALGVDVDELDGLADDRIQVLRERREPDFDDDVRELYSDPEEGSDDVSGAAEIDALFQSLRGSIP